MQPSPPRRPGVRLLIPRPFAAPALAMLAPLALYAAAAPASETKPAPTYHRDIAPLVHAHCMACHRAGESAPFPLTSYEEVSRRARTVQRVVADRYMPPWHANPETTNFLDVRRLDEDEIALFDRWVEAGRPEGDPADGPEPPAFPEGWQLGEPDLVLTMAEAFPVPAEGSDIYRNFVIPLGLDEDKWVKAVELRPSARSAVHHTLFFLDSSGEARKLDGKDGKPGFGGMSFRNSGSLGAYVPGATPRKLPGDFARALPKGSDLVLAHHFHPSGRAELEASTVGIYFAETPPQRPFQELQVPPNFGRGMDIDIPAGESEYVVEDRFTLPSDVQAVTITGHAHYLGRTMRMTATLPDGSERVLLDIPDWDLNWQDTYHFAEETILPAGTVLHARITYDNSADNPNNPHSPPRRVKWGRESTDEMGSITLGGIVLAEDADSRRRRATRRQGAETPIEVILFVAIDCPIANSYAPEINRLHADYGDRGVALSLVYPEHDLEDTAVASHRETFSLAPEGRIDREHREVRRAGATMTPEAAVFDRDGTLRYRGRIDDLYADYRKRRSEPTERTLREVLDRLLAGEDFEFFETESLGCFIEPLP